MESSGAYQPVRGAWRRPGGTGRQVEHLRVWFSSNGAEMKCIFSQQVVVKATWRMKSLTGRVQRDQRRHSRPSPEDPSLGAGWRWWGERARKPGASRRFSVPEPQQRPPQGRERNLGWQRGNHSDLDSAACLKRGDGRQKSEGRRGRERGRGGPGRCLL